MLTKYISVIFFCSLVLISLNAQNVKDVPPTIYAPFYGDYGKSTNGDQWYGVTNSPAHKDYLTFDDTNAIDFNVGGPDKNLDRNLPVIAPCNGKVVKWGTTFPGTSTGGSYGAVMIAVKDPYYYGIMHMKDINVKEGDTVSQGQTIGTVSNKSPNGITEHIHFAFYKKINIGTDTKPKYKLISQPLSFEGCNNFDLTFNYNAPSKKSTYYEIKVGKTMQVSASVPFFSSKYKIEDIYYVNSTWWTSENKEIATVTPGDQKNKSGLIKGIKEGKTRVKLLFSGKVFYLPVTIVK